MEDKYVVYIHTNKLNGKKYVGMTKNPKDRFSANGRRYASSIKFMNAINKYGWGNFEHEIVSNWVTKEEAQELERSLIAQLGTQINGYNIHEGGGGGNNLDSEGLKLASRRMRELNLNPHTNPQTNGTVVWGKTHPYILSTEVIVTEPDGTIRKFDLVKDCASYYGICNSQMCRILKGKQPYKVSKHSKNKANYQRIDGCYFESIKMRNGKPVGGEGY